MRRLARRLFTLCSAASLLLCVAVCVLWVRSYSSVDYKLFPDSDGWGGLVLDSQRGVIMLRAYGDVDPASGQVYLMTVVPPLLAMRHAALLGVTILLPAAYLVGVVRDAHRARRREAMVGLCPNCGYDLRATPGRCPECGTAAADKGSPPATDPATT